MVKKTKKEKQAADLRKKALFSSKLSSLSNRSEVKSTSSENLWVKKDLAKSFFLALVVLIFQLVLYWQL
ncbi:MAG: hypothetical protein XD98_0306 [Microgenomates bacterium 39_6]|nr:MAG: hypothetical protein XD98_0306 [Microgenomates bacterium 39_6]